MKILHYKVLKQYLFSYMYIWSNMGGILKFVYAMFLSLVLFLVVTEVHGKDFYHSFFFMLYIKLLISITLFYCFFCLYISWSLQCWSWLSTMVLFSSWCYEVHFWNLLLWKWKLFKVTFMNIIKLARQNYVSLTIFGE